MLLRDELQQVATKEQLRSFEVPRDFLIEQEGFSQKNGLLSSVRKRLRPALKAKYAKRLEALYELQEQGQAEELQALKDPSSTLSVIEKLSKLLEVNLGIKGIDTSKQKTFAELGGDSLGAVLFSKSIEEIFEVTIPANTILSPTGNIKAWVKIIEANELQQDTKRPTFTSIHGKDSVVIAAKDLQLAHFLSEEIVATAETLAETLIGKPTTVLLTGANGFLGHILCLTWLERLAKNNGKLICLIRGRDKEAAKLRLDTAFQGMDKAMEQRYEKLAAQHLEVLAGDVSDQNLGLSLTDFERLANEVDRICHPAALVNHRLEYPHLFGPNVLGTAEIIRLAITERKKPIDFISSVAVERFLDTSKINNEASPLLAQIQTSNQYAAGYGASKWAAEHLLQNANRDLACQSIFFVVI